MWPFLTVPDILQMRATAQEFNDATKCGPDYEIFFFLVKPGREPHVSTAALFCTFPLARLEA